MSKTEFEELRIVLKYKKSGKSEITSIKRISKPGLRVYSKKDESSIISSYLALYVSSLNK